MRWWKLDEIEEYIRHANFAAPFGTVVVCVLGMNRRVSAIRLFAINDSVAGWDGTAWLERTMLGWCGLN
jgi:hypothetical protein